MYIIKCRDGRFFSREDIYDRKIFLVKDIGLAELFRTEWLASRRLKQLRDRYDDILYITKVVGDD